MCSIMSFTGKSPQLIQTMKDGFFKTKSRGPDMSEMVETKTGYICFHRLAIMDLHPSGMQPFKLDSDYLVCNGEIYGFRSIKKELAQKYQFVSESDCEILLPLYHEHGLDMFKMLDAEFALIIYDGKTDSFIAARDPIGIRPLYYGKLQDGSLTFASEAKNLVGICDIITPFPPGHYYAHGKFVCYCDLTKVDQFCYDDLDTICDGIQTRLTKGIEKRMDADAPLGFLLSGGLDSSLVCAVSARLTNKPLRTFGVGMKTDAIDLKYAKQVANHIKSEHTEIIITSEDVLFSLENVIKILGTYDITTIRASMGMYLICKAIHETTDIRVLMTGEISDELFGYKYTDFAPSPDAFQQESAKRLNELHMYDVLRADRCISANSIEARIPFGDLEFVKYVMAIDPAKKMNSYKMGKYLLRRAFKNNYLPHSILYREKAAFSDAVGHSLVDDIKTYAETKYSEKEFTEKCKKYSFAKPFTKESLLYRELFEKHYPGQAEMIKDFWMPNKEWEGCNVNDPSARVLSNYGESGK